MIKKNGEKKSQTISLRVNLKANHGTKEADYRGVPQNLQILVSVSSHERAECCVGLLGAGPG